MAELDPDDLMHLTNARFDLEESLDGLDVAELRSLIATADRMHAAAETETTMTEIEPVPDTLRRFTPFVSREALDDVCDGLGGDEVEVLVRIAKRLAMGRTTYGPLQIAKDPRAFRSKEAREELEDFLVYLACAWIRAEGTEVTR